LKILFVCTANSCRSQMAEAWARKLAPDTWDIHSAGLLTYRITAKTKAVMAEVGLDMAGQKPQTIDKVDLNSFDLIVTLSQEAGQYLPTLAHPERHQHHRPAEDLGRLDEAAVGLEEDVDGHPEQHDGVRERRQDLEAHVAEALARRRGLARVVDGEQRQGETARVSCRRRR